MQETLYLLALVLAAALAAMVLLVIGHRYDVPGLSALADAATAA